MYLASETQGFEYMKFRPKPPDAMIQRIMQFLQSKDIPELRNLAVDVGCGSGQCTQALAPHFAKVIAIDEDPEQIRHALQALAPYKNVVIKLGRAEKMECESGSVGLVTGVQCAHWFKLDEFYKEAERVLAPGGVLALAGYRLPLLRLPDLTTDLTNHVLQLYTGLLGEYVSPGSRMVYFNNYQTDEFNSVPFFEEPVIREDFETQWKVVDLLDLVGYLKTTSTYQNYIKEHGTNAGEEIIQQFCTRLKWPPKIALAFSYFLLLSRKPL